MFTFSSPSWFTTSLFKPRIKQSQAASTNWMLLCDIACTAQKFKNKSNKKENP